MGLETRNRIMKGYHNDSPLACEIRRISLLAFPQHNDRECLVSLAFYRVGTNSGMGWLLTAAFRRWSDTYQWGATRTLKAPVPDEQKVAALQDFAKRTRPATMARWALYLRS